jgi:glutaredoxin
MHKTIFLYATTGCHLCERAERLLASMPELHRFTVTVIDVVDHPGAFEKYAEHIPVLEAEGLEGVLRWPFHADQVLDFLDRAER